MSAAISETPGRLPSNCFHWTDKCTTSYKVPQMLGLKIVPHLLFPDPKVWACEDRDGGVEVVVVGRHFKKSFCKETYHQLTVDNDDLKRKELLCITQVPCLCVVHSIGTRGASTIRVEGTATSNELVVVQAVQVNAQASGRWQGPITCWAGIAW